MKKMEEKDQMSKIIVNENDINIIIEITEEKDVRLLHFSAMPFYTTNEKSDEEYRWHRLVEIQETGENQDDHHSMKHTGTSPGSCLKYIEHKDYRNNQGRKLEIKMEDEGLFVISHLQLIDNIPIVRSWTEIINTGDRERGIEYVSSFALTGIAKEGLQSPENKASLHIPHNTWYGEAQWREYSLSELGLSNVNKFSLKEIGISSTGTWSSYKYLPMGAFENKECNSVLFWQIEHNGSWHWEISDIGDEHLYLQLSGPTESENGWWKNLRQGESFESIPVAIGSVTGDFEDAMGKITQYRRKTRRPNEDNKSLKIIFNDYMNCLEGDPTTEKLIPLIDAAAEVGCEYFCIDCGWYSDGSWWTGVGEWKPSKRRFPNGINEPLEYIRSKGMIPGLWLEIEVMGINCPMVSEISDDWFFKRHGKPIIDHGRYQLDFRNSEVVKHADSVIERLVNEYGIGYIKMDYNINAGLGTETDADSFGEGLLKHNRAYLAWLDKIFEKYPDLVIENCGSGGLRMDYALLSRHSIQSSSDQTDYRKYATIAASVPSAVTPEQCAIWSYPLKDGDLEETAFNMVNAMLMRVHQSGHLAELSDERLSLVREGLEYYKKIRTDIPKSLPFWPLGLPTFEDQWISLGLRCGNKCYIAVWRMESQTDTCSLKIKGFEGKAATVKCTYPQKFISKSLWNKESGILTVKLPNNNTARIFEIELI